MSRRREIAQNNAEPAAQEAPGLGEFKAAFDPIFQRLSPTQEYFRPLPRDIKRAIIVAAQNATPVHADWWRVINVIASHLGAELFVVPLRYKNPTSVFGGSQRNAEWWAPEVRPYLWNVRHQMNENLTLMADIKIQPTRSSPLSGKEAISLASSGIYGHVKVHTRSVATPQNRMAKLLMTSGACTVQNYTDSDTGKVGQFHHSLSAVLVELDGKKFYARRLHYCEKRKSCIDAGTGKEYYANGIVSPMPRALAIIMGDTHVRAIDKKVDAATFGAGGIVEVARPLHRVWHDLLDAQSCNRHHRGRPFHLSAKRAGHRDNVREEVEEAIEHVRDRTPKGTFSEIVASNHDDMLKQWVESTDWKQETVNQEFYLESALAMLRGTRNYEGGIFVPSPFKHWFDKAKVPRARVLDGESFVLGGVELSLHGHQGPNGARGSITNLRRIGVKTIIGHSHSPGEDEGCVQVGTSSVLNLEYRGPVSSWLNTHCVLNADGKRQLITIIDGKWRLE